jgi:non-homologous end joining protein Ku
MVPVVSASFRARICSPSSIRSTPELRVHTLRFGDELRDPAKMGIHAPAKADARLVGQMTRALGALKKKAFDPDAAFVGDAPDLMDLAREKLAKGKDVVDAPEADEASAEAEADADSDAKPAGADVVDLLALIQDRLKAPGAGHKKAGARKR